MYYMNVLSKDEDTFQQLLQISSSIYVEDKTIIGGQGKILAGKFSRVWARMSVTPLQGDTPRRFAAAPFAFCFLLFAICFLLVYFLLFVFCFLCFAFCVLRFALSWPSKLYGVRRGCLDLSEALWGSLGLSGALWGNFLWEGWSPG